jgi:1-aminocyclopropane-1-carboxylate deaminase
VDLNKTIAPTPLQVVKGKIVEDAGVQLLIKRDDLIHPQVSGNKWRKLKYNLLEAQKLRVSVLLTFGGAYSNHLYAVAAAGASLGIATVGIVRGDELNPDSSPTLQFCHQKGMQLHFVSRFEYRKKESGETAVKLINSSCYVIPEGGSNSLALPGVGELVGEVEAQFGAKPDYFAVAAGTGGTAAGILWGGGNLLAFPVLKGANFLEKDISTLLADEQKMSSLTIMPDYHFGGYAKYSPNLLDFIQHFEKDNLVLLEQVYTGKLLFGLYDLIKKGYFKKHTTIVAVHTGGLQGRLPQLDGR